MGKTDPLATLVDVAANIYTGGLYGLGTGIASGVEGHPVDPLAQVVGREPGSGLSLPVYGSGAMTPGGLPGTNQTDYNVRAGQAAAGSGQGTTGALSQLTPEANTGTQIGGPGVGSSIELGQLGAGVGGFLAPYFGGSAGTGALLGLTAGQQGAGYLNLGGGSPLSMPMGGAMPSTPGAPMPAAQQALLLGAQQNDPHRGLAPRFEQRIAGTRESPGLSTLPLTTEYYRQG